MRTIIAGGRDYHITQADVMRLNQLRNAIPITEVVNGKARGVDTAGRLWAINRDIPVKDFDAEWEVYGRTGPNHAGNVRNQEMADYAEVLIAFPGGDGTDDMVNRARVAGLVVFDYREDLGLF